MKFGCDEMIQLVPMTEDEFEAFMEISMPNHIQDQVKAGLWDAENAEANMQKLLSQVLPDGLATPNHSFFMINDANTGSPVGGLWYVLMKDDGDLDILVLDIQIDPASRRRGYGTQAFLAMEEQARGMGAGAINLNVFKHNTAARAMYEKLGYLGDSEMMVKRLESGIA